MSQGPMSMPCRPVRFAALLAVLIALVAANGSWACTLPLDPYVVALPDSINGVPVTQFHGWVQNPNPGDPDNNQAWSGYLVVPAGAQVSWRIYWDPTEGGTNPTGLAKLGITGVNPDKTQFDMLRGPPAVKADLYDLSFAQNLGLTSFKKPMKVQEVYDRDAGTGGWAASVNRVSAPWEIPNNGTLEEIKDENGVPFTPAMSLGATISKIANDKGIGQNPNGGWLSTMFGSGPQYGSTPNGPKVVTGPGQAGYSWNMVPGSGHWTQKGGTWTFVDVKGRWKMNVKQTGKTYQPDTDVQGLSISFKFDTPSEPFFYLVRPIGEFEFNLSTDPGEFYTWTETKTIYDSTGNVTSTPITGLPQPEPDNNPQLTASGIFKKGSSGPAGGVPTLVMVTDSNAPHHVHLDNQNNAAFTAAPGAPVAGSAKFYVVDDNPYAGYTGTLPTLEPKGGPPMLFDPSKAKADFYYSMPVNDFVKGDLTQLANPPDGDFDQTQSGALNTFPILKERWKWFKAPNQANIVFKDPFVDGQSSASPPASGIYGNGQNPSFTYGEVNIDATYIDNPLPIQFAPSSLDNTNPDGSTLQKYDKRIKFFIKPTDASGNTPPLTEFSGADVLPTATGQTAPSAQNPVPAPDPYITGQAAVAVAAPPPFNWQPAVPGGCAHDKTKLGTMGFVDATADTVRPNVVMLVKDTKYNRTYIVNDQQQGWWSHPQAIAGTAGTGTTEDNKEWPNILPAKDIEIVEFGTAAGGSDPNAFTAQIASGWTSYTTPSTRNGIYVDEDTRLVFQVLAWDNVNWKATPINPGASTLEWSIKDDPSSANLNQAALPDLSKGKFEYVFRNPNFGPNVVGSQDCSVTVDAYDAANIHRRLITHFYVASNKLKILTLEEKRQNK